MEQHSGPREPRDDGKGTQRKELHPRMLAHQWLLHIVSTKASHKAPGPEGMVWSGTMGLS